MYVFYDIVSCTKNSKKLKIFEYMAAGRPILCIGSSSNFEIGKVLKMTNAGVVFKKHEIKKLQDLIYKTYYGHGLFSNYKSNINEVLSFSRKRIANNFLREINNRFLNIYNLSSTFNCDIYLDV